MRNFPVDGPPRSLIPNWFLRLVASAFVKGAALAMMFIAPIPTSLSSVRMDPPEEPVPSEGSVVVIANVSVTPINPVPPVYVLPPINVVDMGDLNVAMSQVFAATWGITYDAANHGIKIEGLQNEVGLIVAGDQRLGDQTVGQSVVTIIQETPVTLFEQMTGQQEIRTAWSSVGIEIMTSSGPIFAVALRTKILPNESSANPVSQAALTSLGDGILTVMSISTSATSAASRSVELASGLDELALAPADPPALSQTWDGFPTQKACMNHALAEQARCYARAHNVKLACCLAVGTLAIGLYLACAALLIGFFVCLAVAIAAELAAMAACKLTYANDLDVCTRNFINYSRTACGVIIPEP